MEKILVVDDIVTNRALLRQALVALGDYEVVEAVSGQEAIELYEKERPDLILMDIMMPDIDGCQATAAIKAKMGEDYIPIIFVTALSSEDSLATALESGGDDFISKPFNIDVLADRKSTRLNSSHRCISYAVFCLKKKTIKRNSLKINTKGRHRVRQKKTNNVRTCNITLVFK